MISVRVHVLVYVSVVFDSIGYNICLFMCEQIGWQKKLLKRARKELFSSHAYFI